jgi:hypothetical protein
MAEEVELKFLANAETAQAALGLRSLGRFRRVSEPVRVRQEAIAGCAQLTILIIRRCTWGAATRAAEPPRGRSQARSSAVATFLSTA